MTEEQKTLVRATYATMLPIADRLSARFYAGLFEAHPEVRPMFLGSIKAQRVKFIDMLDSILQSLDHLDRVVTTVWQLGKRHAGYGVQPVHYGAVREALLGAMQNELGPAFTPEAYQAWGALYDLIAEAMQQSASEGAIPRQ